MVSVILTLRDQLSNNSVKGAFGVFFSAAGQKML